MIFKNYKEIAENALYINHNRYGLAAADIGINSKTLQAILAGSSPTARAAHKLLMYFSHLHQKKMIKTTAGGEV